MWQFPRSLDPAAPAMGTPRLVRPLLGAAATRGAPYRACRPMRTGPAPDVLVMPIDSGTGVTADVKNSCGSNGSCQFEVSLPGSNTAFAYFDWIAVPSS